MKITIVGGGNIGTQFAVHCAEKGHDVIVFTSNPSIFQKKLRIVDDTGCITHEGFINQATDHPEIAFTDRDLIFITYPADVIGNAAKLMTSYVNEKTIIGVVPGNGGSECVFRQFIENGNTFFLIERVPAIARIVKKGETVKSTGYRSELHISSLPQSKASECSDIVNQIFDMECKVIPYLLNLTLTPSNPILHTTRLRTIFKEYQPGVTYDRVPLFYEEWNDESSELLLKCDDEVQKICKALPEHHLENVKSLRDHYQSYTIQQMTNKISGIPAFKGIKTPSVQIDGRYIPDLHSRYFTADFSYGLSIIRQVAEFAGVDTPFIDETMEWYKNIAIEHNEFHYSDYGIHSKEEFDQFYLR